MNYKYPDSLKITGQSSSLHEGLLSEDQYSLLKKGIWLYFLLIIFEGALRKWFLPMLATPLLVVRDPIALWLVLTTWRKGLLPANIYLKLMIVIGIVSIFTATLLGHGSLPVAIYGARIIMLHFPLMFVIGRLFTREDVVQLGKSMMWLSIPMAFLIFMQFYSPQSAWVNRGVGGDVAGAGFDGANGYFRPPATFSFTIGTHLFFSFASCFIFYFWLNPKQINKLILIGATGALVAAIPLSISRSLLFYVLVTLLFTIIAISRKPEYLGKMVVVGIGGLLLMIVLSKAGFFQTATDAFLARFSNASKAEGGLKGTLGDRYFGGMFSAISENTQIPFFGYGTGMGTNVGAMLLTGKSTFLIAEAEWGRIIGEVGLLMGLGIILVRLGICIKFAIACYRKLAKGDLLPWLLLSYGLLIIPQGQWAQPTYLGFSTLIGGLIIASLRESTIIDSSNSTENIIKNRLF
jgi:hypothetical protein